MGGGGVWCVYVYISVVVESPPSGAETESESPPSL